MHVPDPVVAFEEEGSEHEVLLAESVGWATRGGSTRSLPLSAHLCRTTCSACHSPTSPPRSTAPEAAAQQLASRPRRRLRNSPEPDRDLARQRRVVDAFLAASRGGDFDALLEVLDSHVELWIDGGALRADASVLLHGAERRGRAHHDLLEALPVRQTRARQRRRRSEWWRPRPRVLGDGARRAEPEAGERPQNGAFVRSRGAAPLRRWRRHSSDVRVDRLVFLHGCRRREAGC